MILGLSNPVAAASTVQTEHRCVTDATDPLMNLLFLVLLLLCAIVWDRVSLPNSHSRVLKKCKTKHKIKNAFKTNKNKPISISALHIRVAFAARHVGHSRVPTRNRNKQYRKQAAKSRFKYLLFKAKARRHRRVVRKRAQRQQQNMCLPLAFPWVQPKWHNDTECSHVELSPRAVVHDCPGPCSPDFWAGGAGGGAKASRWKRFEKASAEAEPQQHSLANTLLSVLQNWQQQPEPHQSWNRAAKKSRYNEKEANAQPVPQEQSLAKALLAVLQKTEYRNNDDLVAAVQSTIHKHVGSTAQPSRPKPVAAAERPRPTTNASTNRWSRAKHAPVMQIARAEWTVPPKLMNLTDVLCKIKSQEALPGNLVEATSPDDVNAVCTYRTTYDCKHNFTLLCTGQAMEFQGNTFSSAKLQRKGAAYRIENISLRPLGDPTACPILPNALRR